MKKEKIIYWTSTAIIAAVMSLSALNFALNPVYREAFQHFGLPNWFRIELTTAKILGVFALVVPAVPRLIKEFAYFGFGLTLISAPIAHLSSGDSALLEIGHAFFFIVLIISYVYFRKLNGRYK